MLKNVWVCVLCCTVHTAVCRQVYYLDCSCSRKDVFNKFPVLKARPTTTCTVHIFQLRSLVIKKRCRSCLGNAAADGAGAAQHDIRKRPVQISMRKLQSPHTEHSRKPTTISEPSSSASALPVCK